MADKVFPGEPYIKRVVAIRLEPHLLVKGIRLRAKPRAEQKITGGPLLGIGDAEIISVTISEGSHQFAVRTFVWQHDLILTFQELLGIFAEATFFLGDPT